MRDVRDTLDSMPSLPYSNNAVLAGVITGFTAERSMAQSYEDFLQTITDFHVELRRKFDILQQLFDGGLLTAQTLDEFHVVLTSLIEVQSYMNDLISSNRVERENCPAFL